MLLGVPLQRQTEKWAGVVVSEVDKSQSGRGEEKDKEKEETRDKRGLGFGRFLFWVYGTYVDEYVCLPLLHLVVTGWRCCQCDWRLGGVQDQSPKQCVTVLLRVVRAFLGVGLGDGVGVVRPVPCKSESISAGGWNGTGPSAGGSLSLNWSVHLYQRSLWFVGVGFSGCNYHVLTSHPLGRYRQPRCDWERRPGSFHREIFIPMNGLPRPVEPFYQSRIGLIF